MIKADDISRVEQMISLRNRPEVPLRSLRVLVIRPSNLKTKTHGIVDTLNTTLDLCKVQAW